MKFTFFLLIFLVVAPVFSQINKGAFDDYLYFVNQTRPSYEGVEGSPYVNESFVPAKVDDFDKVIYIKFNAFANNIEFRSPENDVAILSLEKDYTFRLLDGSNAEYEVHDYINDENVTGRTFFKKVRSGANFNLYQKQNVKYVPKKLATSGFEQNQPAKFIKTNVTFYVNKPVQDSMKLVPVPTRKKEIAAFLNVKSSAVKQYIKEENLKLGSEDDLVKILNHYWSLD